MALNIKEPDYFKHDRLNLFKSLMVFLKNTQGMTVENHDEDIKRHLRESGLFDYIGGLALDQRNKVVDSYFKNIIDQPAYYSSDYIRLRQLILNWYSSLRTINQSQKDATNPFYLSGLELNELIKSFGFPYPEQLIGRVNKVNFLYNLIDFYQKKGSPLVFQKALGFFGFKNAVISEWWVIKKPDGEVVFRSQPILPRNKRNDVSLILEESFEEHYSATDPLWQLSSTDVQTFNTSSDIKLPSLTPYISVQAEYNTSKIVSALAILTRKLRESHEFWIKYVLELKGDSYGFLNDPNYSVVLNRKYIIGDEPLGIFSGKSNQYATKTNKGWIFETPVNQQVVKNIPTTTHWVYNGTEWVDLDVLLSESDIGSKRQYDRPNKLFNDVPLNGYEGTFSSFIVSLAIDYLFNSEFQSTEELIYQYNGPLVPFDKGVYGSSGTSGTSGYRDDIDDQTFDPIIENWRVLTKRPKLREDRDIKYSMFKSRFTGEIDYSSSSSFISAFENSEKFLTAMAGGLKEAIDYNIIIQGRDTVLENVFSDFEFYMMRDLQILEIPITNMVLGVPLKRRLKDVVNFFKPFRVRLLDFIAIIDLGNPLENSQLEKDYLETSLIQYLVDKGPWELDQGLVKDDLITTPVLLNDIYLARVGQDSVYLLDRSFKDEFTLDVSFETAFIELWRELDPDYNEITATLFIRDDCPGDQDLFDSSTVTDSVEINVVEI